MASLEFRTTTGWPPKESEKISPYSRAHSKNCNEAWMRQMRGVGVLRWH